MHEFSLMQNLMELVVAKAREQKAQRIHAIRLRVGALSGVVAEALAFAHDVITQGTLAEGSTLVVEAVPVVCYCARCNAEFEADGFICECPRCGFPSSEIRRGRELELVDLEVS